VIGDVQPESHASETVGTVRVLPVNSDPVV
jgi:hypothetical protein